MGGNVGRKEIGADPRLITIISAERIMNNGCGVLLFVPSFAVPILCNCTTVLLNTLTFSLALGLQHLNNKFWWGDIDEARCAVWKLIESLLLAFGCW